MWRIIRWIIILRLRGCWGPTATRRRTRRGRGLLQVRRMMAMAHPPPRVPHEVSGEEVGQPSRIISITTIDIHRPQLLPGGEVIIAIAMADSILPMQDHHQAIIILIHIMDIITLLLNIHPLLDIIIIILPIMKEEELIWTRRITMPTTTATTMNNIKRMLVE